jgi:putative oxidoreductase
MNLGRVLARTVIGGLFIGHGTQKWFGWFDGPGLDKTEKMMGSLSLEPGRANAVAASATETVGGAMLIAGALTPVAATGLIATMITAVRTVHLKNGLWGSNGGYEFNLALIAALLAIVDGGPGSPSVDGALGIDDTGSRWALAALAGGVVGSTLVIEAGRRRAAAGAVAQTASPNGQAASASGREEPAAEREMVGTAVDGGEG